jgi:hypothetical protein
MRIGIQGTRNFNDYTIFLRAMGTAMSSMTPEDNELFIYTAGPMQINQMAMEFSNVSERSLKARGIKIKLFKVPPSYIKNNIHDIDYFAFFSKPKEAVSEIVDVAEAKDISVGIYRY